MIKVVFPNGSLMMVNEKVSLEPWCSHAVQFLVDFFILLLLKWPESYDSSLGPLCTIHIYKRSLNMQTKNCNDF